MATAYTHKTYTTIDGGDGRPRPKAIDIAIQIRYLYQDRFAEVALSVGMSDLFKRLPLVGWNWIVVKRFKQDVSFVLICLTQKNRG